MSSKRCCGVLLHPTSLPGPEGIGTLGADARRMIDLLAGMGMSLWQMLPLTPPACGNSPYSAFSAFAGNPLLIDLEQLVREGDLPALKDPPVSPDTQRIDFSAVLDVKLKALHAAATSFLAAERSQRKEEFWHFCDSTPWLHDYALFMALHDHYGGKPWSRWPRASALISQKTYEQASVSLGADVGYYKYIQWQFYRQWYALKQYAAEKGVRMVGDLPIFVAYDSVDVWRNRDLFLLDAAGRPTVVAGVPPDYFSRTGQLWGNPLYNWDAMRACGFSWWIERLRHQLNMFDVVRIDHFRGFEAAWHVPAGQRTARGGSWVSAPGVELFDTFRTVLGNLPLIAEDLGVITPEVEQLRDRYGFPGMKILQFAFGSGGGNPYLPHNHIKNSVVYSGTHDNDTTVGWSDSLDESTRTDACRYLGSDREQLPASVLRSALMSVADTVILPMQDLLGLPTASRMNIPGTADGNWGWRFSWSVVPHDLAAQVSDQLSRYGRHT